LVIAGLLVGYALVSRKLHGWWVSMPAAMLTAGYLVGPGGFDLLNLGVGSEVVKLVAEITLALMLFHDASRIGLTSLRGQASLPLRLLGIGLPVMIVLGTVVAYVFFPSAGWLAAALMATMLAPTDAALGEEVVSDSRLPGWLRQGLNVESGLNDGLSVPIFLVLLGVAAAPEGWQSGALLSEFARTIGFGVAAGIVLGGGGGLLVRAARQQGYMLGSWVRYAVLAIALSCYVGAAVLHGSGFIGAFVGGLMFGTVSEQRGASAMGLTSHLGTAFDTVSFVLLGAVLLPIGLQYLTWQVLLYAVLSLVVIRVVAVFTAMLGTRAAWQTTAFMGWFGPRGLATVVFTVMLLEEDIANTGAIAAVAIVGVALSVFAHGFSAPPLAGVYARWYSSRVGSDEKMPERLEVTQPPTRGFALRDEQRRTDDLGA
jgi:NhaP-type Na+/H+ or K+/H+ antiporter